MRAPTKEVPPAKRVIAITVRISVGSIAVLFSHLTRGISGGSICMLVLSIDHLWKIHNLYDFCPMGEARILKSINDRLGDQLTRGKSSLMSLPKVYW
jgi:hypothetical protein